MTKKQLEILAMLHADNTAHSRIAEILDVPLLDVDRACAQLDREQITSGEQYLICKECGSQIIYERKTRPRLFCCKKCSQTWRNKKRHTVSGTSRENDSAKSKK